MNTDTGILLGRMNFLALYFHVEKPDTIKIEIKLLAKQGFYLHIIMLGHFYFHKFMLFPLKWIPNPALWNTDNINKNDEPIHIKNSRRKELLPISAL